MICGVSRIEKPDQITQKVKTMTMKENKSKKVKTERIQKRNGQRARYIMIEKEAKVGTERPARTASEKEMCLRFGVKACRRQS